MIKISKILLLSIVLVNFSHTARAGNILGFLFLSPEFEEQLCLDQLENAQQLALARGEVLHSKEIIPWLQKAMNFYDEEPFLKFIKKLIVHGILSPIDNPSLLVDTMFETLDPSRYDISQCEGILDLLLKAGADPGYSDNEDNSLTTWCIYSGSVAGTEHLINSGLNIPPVITVQNYEGPPSGIAATIGFSLNHSPEMQDRFLRIADYFRHKKESDHGWKTRSALVLLKVQSSVNTYSNGCTPSVEPLLEEYYDDRFYFGAAALAAAPK